MIEKTLEESKSKILPKSESTEGNISFYKGS